jgi:2-methylfumaryl-CoA hydratase
MTAVVSESLAGPFGDDLVLGESLPAAPAITLDGGAAAQYQAICGDPAQLSLSAPLSRAVSGVPSRVVNSGLVLQIAIGQSTVATRIVIANLFYRNVTVHRQVHVGETLSSTVTPTACAYTSGKGKGRRAKVLLSIETHDEHGELVVSLERLALLPLREQDGLVESGGIGTAAGDRALADLVAVLPPWDLTRLSRAPLPPTGWQVIDPLRDSVSGALELVRLTQNLASAHRDPQRGQHGRRLVYGGHTIALAQSSLTRMVPGLAAVVGWRSCDHLAAVFDDDLLSFQITCEERLAVEGGALIAFRIRGRALRQGTEPVDAIDFRPIALMAGAPGGHRD